MCGCSHRESYLASRVVPYATCHLVELALLPLLLALALALVLMLSLSLALALVPWLTGPSSCLFSP